MSEKQEDTPDTMDIVFWISLEDACNAEQPGISVCYVYTHAGSCVFSVSAWNPAVFITGITKVDYQGFKRRTWFALHNHL